MNKVVNIHLGGNAYQLEESAYDTLRAYLGDAEVKLANNPDKDEIVKDLEQAIGAKCDAYLSAHKTVVLAPDIAAVLAEMGPVSDAEGAASGTAEPDSVFTNKRLYQIREGAMIAGVCAGLAAYFNVDVLLVRILFVVLTVITHGAGIALYILLMLFVPVARNAKDYEAAAGVPPITAQLLIDRTKASYDEVMKNSHQWRNWAYQWKDQRHAWKEQHKAWKRAQRKASRAYAHQGRVWQDRPRSFLRELNEFIWSMFGLLVVSFCIWFVYHHVPLVAQFFDSLKALWDRAIYALSQAIDHSSI